ncbi:hypothetical protein AB835_02465 [Candidatus Endobugula sertula]|uniref:L-ornithine N(alpha)-acyltransferase n=1 Tax=Candidatus Endobugula sertula TaxID=62101 RepID=A0A1D2QSP7_9GAMM|nr:hypothetical protein AB835_02465 [Candidatus Endobugula sertula]
MTLSVSSNMLPKLAVNKGIELLNTLVMPPATHAGRYTVRFAKDIQEVQAAQALRYRVFYKEMQGQPTEIIKAEQLDMDQWDEAGFHIIVLDSRALQQPAVVGTLRLFYSECLESGQDFYTGKAFDLSLLKSHYSHALELSRFCVDSNGRGGVILMLIWKYAMSFIQDNHIPVMLGCASFSGTDETQHLPILNYLYEHHLAPEALRPKPKGAGYVDLAAFYEPNTAWEEAQKSIPTLLRGYLKLGAKISDAAIIDHVFNTVFIAIYVETRHMLEENPSLVTHV